jgi:DNA-directed RNA polymerase subunit RPC12/RpoP
MRKIIEKILDKFKVVKICESKLEEDLYDDGANEFYDEEDVDEITELECPNCGGHRYEVDCYNVKCLDCGTEWEW